MQFSLAYKKIVDAASIYSMDIIHVKYLYERLVQQLKEEVEAAERVRNRMRG